MTKEQEMLIASLKYMLPEEIYNQVLVLFAEKIVQKDKTEDNIVERNVDCLLHNIENGHFIKCDVCDVNWHKGCMCCIEHLKNSEEINTIKQALLKSQEQEKENEILKEIIKSLFDKGSPLHQYVDKEFGLTIEVDSECSIMHLGEYKGVDLDKFLKEVLK